METNKEGRLRQKQLRVWLTDDEHSMLYEKARYLGITASEYVRKIIAHGHIINHRTKELAAVATAVNRIGVNINNIARHAHAIGAVTQEDFETLKEAYSELADEYVILLYGDIFTAEKIS